MIALVTVLPLCEQHAAPAPARQRPWRSLCALERQRGGRTKTTTKTFDHDGVDSIMNLFLFCRKQMHWHEWPKVPFKLLFLPPNGRKSRRIDYKLHRQCSCWWWWGMSWCLVWERCHCGSPHSHSCPAHQVQGNLGLIVNKSFGLKILSFIVQTACSWSKPKAKYQVKTEGNLSAVVSNNWNVFTVPKELMWTRFSFCPIFTFLRHFYSLLVTQNQLSELLFFKSDYLSKFSRVYNHYLWTRNLHILSHKE